MSSACWMRSLVMSSPLELFISSLNQTFGWALLSARSQTLASPCRKNTNRYSRMGHSDFGLFVKSDGSCGMKRDGIPNNLHLLRRDASPLQKRARRIGAIHLETIFRRIAVSQAQIMQNRGYCQQFGIRSTFSAF